MNSTMPLYEYECDACQQRFERIQKYSGSHRSTSARSAARGPSASCCRPPPFSSRASGFYITDYAQEVVDRAPAEDRRRRRSASSDIVRATRAATSRSNRRRSRRADAKSSDKTAEVDVRSASAASVAAPACRGRASRRYSRNGSARSGRRSAKYTTAFRNPSLLPVSWRTPLISQP